MKFEYSKETDEKWQKKWEENQIYAFDPTSEKEKIYLLEMFSYPSGSRLHLGHWWNYSLPDSWGRMKRMQGYNVFHPMGFDAFGLPAENYAIKTGVHPKDSTDENIKTMEGQLKKIGATYDWKHEIKTCEPEYYQWTQWLFLQLYKAGLAYKKEAPVNWCPNCKTVLANEQAMGGVCERCDSQIIRKPLSQWFFAITKYADELIEGLDKLDWPEKTKQIQRNWIGRSEGTEVVFDVKDSEQKIAVFTTRVDTIMGLSYLVISPEHRIVSEITTDACRGAVEEYVREAAKKTEIDRMATDKEKTGVFTGAYAVHPLNGELIPIWLGDYVIASYGTGAVMAVPAHDERDFVFAEKFRLPIQQVIRGNDENTQLPYCEKGFLVNSGKYDGLSSKEAIQAIEADLEQMGKGRHVTNYRLRDWLISRQRYWGAPIPIVYCEKCGEVPVDEKDLPVELPYDVEFRPDGKSPLASCAEFVHTTCPHCGGPAVRETDTLDTFVCSSWYYLRYCDPQNHDQAWDVEKAAKLMPVDKYIGGIEHAAMHLLYARFIYKVLRDLGLAKGDEPFASLIHQGTILGVDGQKMSKSKGNTVSPDEYIEKYGSDVFRTYLAFGFAYTDGGPWSDDGIKAIHAYFKKITNMLSRFDEGQKDMTDVYEEDDELEFTRHTTIKRVTDGIENFQFNTSIARMMEFRTAIAKYQKKVNRSRPYERDVLIDFIKLLSPFAPHFAEEVWESLGFKESIFNSSWPVADAAKTVSKTVEMVIQINGKIKDRITVANDADTKEIEKLALEQPAVVQNIAGHEIKKVIIVKNRLVNIVIQ